MLYGYIQRAMEVTGFIFRCNKINRVCDGQACSHRPWRSKVIETRITDKHLASGKKNTCLYSEIDIIRRAFSLIVH
jgi:hypothetical protein